MKQNKIGVFDSGTGGLYVLNELIKKYPNNKYYYYGDTLNMPYGNKKKEDLLKCVNDIISYFTKLDVDMIVCACGTVSTTILSELQKNTDKPIISVVDSTINYVNSKKFKNILVIATMNTINSMYFQERINSNATCIGLENLAYYIENGISFKEYLDNELDDNDYDAVILGCTHYVKVKSYLKKRYHARIIDMGKCLSSSINLDNENDMELNIYFSKYLDNTLVNIEKILGSEVYGNARITRSRDC